jgi:tetratricopeptide (TPR) repeat protein
LSELGQIAEGGPIGAEHAILAMRASVRLFDEGRYEQANVLLAGVEASAGPILGDPLVLPWLNDARATRALFAGDPGEYLRLMYEVVMQLEAAGDLRTACLQRVNAGYGFLSVGDWVEAERVLREALALAEKLGLHHIVSSALNNLGVPLMHLGALEEARQVEEQAAAAFHAQGGRRMEGSSRSYLGTILMLSGDLAGAEREELAAIELLRASPPNLAQALARLAEIRLMRGQTAKALDAASEAARVLEALGGTDDGESIVRLAHAVALEAAGHPEAARVAVLEAEKRLLERAARIADASIRRSFLERVPENARTLVLAEKLRAT